MESSSPQFWNNLYKDNNTRWDIGGPTPIVVDYLKKNNINKRVCVLGCGNGHDAVAFSSFGHDVYAVDFSEEALKNLDLIVKKRDLDVKLINENIFDLSGIYADYFDIVFEYTCYCAIDPLKRSDYFTVVHKILKSGAILFGIFVPIDAEMNDEDGPPFSITIEEIKTLIKNKFIIQEEYFSELTIEPRKKREKVLILKKI